MVSHYFNIGVLYSYAKETKIRSFCTESYKSRIKCVKEPMGTVRQNEVHRDVSVTCYSIQIQTVKSMLFSSSADLMTHTRAL